MKKLVRLTLSIFLLVSCNKEDTPSPHPNLGNYDLISLTSNIPLDLNYDNIKTTNFKAELSYYYQGSRNPKYDLRIIQSNRGYDEWFFMMQLARDYYHPDQSIIDLRYHSGDYSKLVLLKDGKVDRITHHLYDASETDADILINEHYPYPYNLTLNSDTMVTVLVKQMFYDLEQETWVLVNLEAVFEKMVEQ